MNNAFDLLADIAPSSFGSDVGGNWTFIVGGIIVAGAVLIGAITMFKSRSKQKRS